MEAAYYTQRLQCSREEKNACLNTLQRIYQYGRAARMRGLLALEEAIEHEPNLFLREGLRQVVDSHEPEFIQRSLQYLLLADDLQGGAFLDAVLAIEGVNMIQAGRNPRYIAQALSYCFGSEFLPECQATLAEVDQEKNRRNSPLPEREHSLIPVFDAMGTLDDMSLQRLLQDVDIWNIAASLMGASNLVRGQVLRQLSARTRDIVEDEFTYFPISESSSRIAQEHILETCRRLEREGELVCNFSWETGSKREDPLVI